MKAFTSANARTMLFSALAMIALVAVFPASSSAKNATVHFDGKGKELFFSGPKTVSSDGTLKLVNDTNPNKVGPHTFSLVRKPLLPRTTNQMKGCFKPGHICRRVAKAHKVDFGSGEVGKPDVDKGKTGWDDPFTENTFGDSFFTEEADERTERKVSAKPGSTLRFMCVIHPDMQGKIEVVK